ncbi:MAG: hypothetical protein ABSD74_14940 [Rhizomicrobium sp.]|jgi:hypothetical protein
MPGYQLFFLSKENKGVRKLEKTHDGEAPAMRKAVDLAQDHTIDVWQDNRRVATIAPGAQPLIFNVVRST